VAMIAKTPKQSAAKIANGVSFESIKKRTIPSIK
jgi:hypothetical protein